MGDTDPRWYTLRDLVRARDYGAAQKLLDADKALLDLRDQSGGTVLRWLAVENERNGSPMSAPTSKRSISTSRVWLNSSKTPARPRRRFS
jgi:hypothetical protein